MYTLKLTKRNHNLVLKHSGSKIRLKHTGNRGPQGLTGPQGPPGTGGTDANFVQDFIVTDTVPINHNLHKYPAVSVMNSAGDEVEANIDHTNINSLVVTFNAPFSGRVTCN